ncbi:MAG: Gfo/Idh/MocA family oxidoreductase [Clostridia bacterium]
MKIGIIGIGFVGQLHAKVLEKIDSNIVYYVYDVATHVAQEFAQNHKCKSFDTIDELYDNVDAIIIATPTFTHYDLVMKAIEKGKHILCEKPMSLRIEEAEKMLVASKQKELICAIGFNYRFFEITEILKKQHSIGDILDIHISIKRLFRKDWHNKENGVLADLGIHLIDYINYLCCEEINLSTCKVQQKYLDGWDYYSKVWGQTESGIPFELIASRIKNPDEVKFSLEIVGTTGNFKYDSRQETSYIIEKNNIANIYNFEKDEKTIDFFDFTDSILKQDNNWIKAILGEKVKKIATFEDGLHAQKALDVFLSKK